MHTYQPSCVSLDCLVKQPNVKMSMTNRRPGCCVMAASITASGTATDAFYGLAISLQHMNIIFFSFLDFIKSERIKKYIIIHVYSIIFIFAFISRYIIIYMS